MSRKTTILSLLMVFGFFCTLCFAKYSGGTGEPNQNTFEHRSFGLSVTKPDSWEFMNPFDYLAGTIGVKLKDKDMEMIIQALADIPVVGLSKECKQVTCPIITITVNPLDINESNLPLDIIKQVSKHAPDIFENYTIVIPPREILISNYKSAYMKAHYTGHLYEDSNEYPTSYETWIAPRKRYFFMIGVVSAQNSSQDIRNEIDSIIKSLKITNEQSMPKTYLDKIIKSNFEEADKYKYTIDDYLEITKPYGIWDIRPRGISQLDVEGEVADIRDVSWYHLGAFNAHLKIPPEDVKTIIENRMKNISYKSKALKDINSANVLELNSFADKVKKSGHNVFISNKKFQRVDDIYFQEGKYWKYDFPKDSFFEISEKKIYISDKLFQDKDKEIIELLKKNGFYGIISQNNAIIIMIDGLLNYSYGYIITSSEQEILNLWPLFNIISVEKIDNATDIYFYFSN